MLGRSFPDWSREGVVGSEETIMPDRSQPSTVQRDPWNKGRLIGQKRPLKPKEVWFIRVRLQLEHRARDLAMFNLAIDSKLRGCDLVRLQTALPLFRRRRGAKNRDEPRAHNIGTREDTAAGTNADADWRGVAKTDPC